MTETAPFNSSTAFCAKCGSILPLLRDFGSVQCFACQTIYHPDSFVNIKFNYTIHFNTVSAINTDNILNMDNPEGPVVERKCPKCGNDRMSYATLQLRSADEGQTVFYTCVSCKCKPISVQNFIKIGKTDEPSKHGTKKLKIRERRHLVKLGLCTVLCKNKINFNTNIYRV